MRDMTAASYQSSSSGKTKFGRFRHKEIQNSAIRSYSFTDKSM